ncbi:MAG: type II and III secretion system protein family protein [Planctomycetes bacterium]|nr:type II and III secretion system protein family protein [Planctomycetota bacterium]
MRTTVMEDRRTDVGVGLVPHAPRPLGRRRIAARLLVTLGVFVPAYAASGQQGATDKPAFQVSVVDMASDFQRLEVPVNRSVIVETTVEAARTDVVAPQIADIQPISPTQMLITGKSYGTTNIILWDANDQQYVLEVNVVLDVSALKAAIATIDPNSQVEVQSVLGNIVLTGRVSGANQARRVVEIARLFMPPSTSANVQAVVQNHMDVAGEQQVLLRCIVAEVSRAAVRELGVNGFLAGKNFRDAFVVNQIGGINPANIGAAADALVGQNIPFLTGTEGIPLAETTTLSVGFPRVQTQLFINALADNSLLRILAEPNLVAISGETAHFLAGGEFPIPVPQGNQQVTIEFRKFGVRLNFTPVVQGNGLVRLRVAPEVSELDFTNSVELQGLLVPGLKSRSAETTVEVGNGQTIIIAGLLSEELRGIASRVPGIGDVPILGALFRSVEYRSSLTELIILVTIEIIAPLEPHQIPDLPGHEVTVPNDFELFALGLVEGIAPDAPGMSASDDATASAGISAARDQLSLHGPWGYADAYSMQ